MCERYAPCLPRSSVAIRVRSAGLYVPTTAGCHSRASLPGRPRTQNPEPAVNDCQLVSTASSMIRPGSFSQVELGGLEPPTPCLQDRPRLSETVAHLGMRQQVRPLGSGRVGSCCGHAWWSALTVSQRRSSDPQIAVCRLALPGSVRVGAGCSQTWRSALTAPPVPAGVREGTGSCPVMVVPWPGADRTSSRPPRAERRSAMFRRPEPMGVWRAS